MRGLPKVHNREFIVLEFAVKHGRRTDGSIQR
jgi:hypothetical protein